MQLYATTKVIKMEKNPIVLETTIKTIETILEKFKQLENEKQPDIALETVKKQIATDLLINKLKLEVSTKGSVEASTIKEIIIEHFN